VEKLVVEGDGREMEGGGERGEEGSNGEVLFITPVPQGLNSSITIPPASPLRF